MVRPVNLDDLFRRAWSDVSRSVIAIGRISNLPCGMRPCISFRCTSDGEPIVPNSTSTAVDAKSLLIWYLSEERLTSDQLHEQSSVPQSDLKLLLPSENIRALEGVTCGHRIVNPEFLTPPWTDNGHPLVRQKTSNF
jgi:hypothetical protein